ncbi:Cytochrome b-c1 complex subunit Rieske, partial [Hortaea werneckii]
MSVTQKAAANLVRHTARQQVPALRQSAAIQQTRTRADASTTTNASFKSPFHRGESSHQDTTVIPSFKKYRAGSEASNKMFSYFMVGAFGGLSALGAKDTVQNFLVNMSASADVLAQAKVEVDISAIPEGKNVIIKWRGKPVFIRHRTADEIKEADET